MKNRKELSALLTGLFGFLTFFGVFVFVFDYEFGFNLTMGLLGFAIAYVIQKWMLSRRN